MDDRARCWISRAGLAALAVGLGAAVVAAEPPEGRGVAEYLKYCASCHGPEGDGQGPVAPVLVPPPSDLTRLAERYGRPLPRQELARFIDGRREVTAHGPRTMPVWGEQLFRDLPSPTPEARRRGTILVLLDHLETLQVAAPAP